MAVAPSITWLLVRIRPEVDRIIPVPAPSPVPNPSVVFTSTMLGSESAAGEGEVCRARVGRSWGGASADTGVVTVRVGIAPGRSLREPWVADGHPLNRRSSARGGVAQER